MRKKIKSLNYKKKLTILKRDFEKLVQGKLNLKIKSPDSTLRLKSKIVRNFVERMVLKHTHIDE